MGNFCSNLKPTTTIYHSDDSPTFLSFNCHGLSLVEINKNVNSEVEKYFEEIDKTLKITSTPLNDFISKAYFFHNKDDTYDGITKIDITYHDFEGSTLEKEDLIEFLKEFYFEESFSKNKLSNLFGIAFDTIVDYFSNYFSQNEKKILKKSMLIPLGFYLCQNIICNDQLKKVEDYFEFKQNNNLAELKEFFLFIFIFSSIVLINIKEKNKDIFGDLSTLELAMKKKCTPQFIEENVDSLIKEFFVSEENTHRIIFKQPEKNSWPFSGKVIRDRLFSNTK